MGLLSMIVGGVMDANKAIKQNQAQGNDEVKTVVVQNRYSIDVPSFLTPTTKLSDDASLQYWNKTLDVTFQVVDEPKSEFIEIAKEIDGISLPDKLANITLSAMFDMDKTEIYDFADTKINGMNAVTLGAFQKRTFFKDALYGTFAFIEGKDTMYQIIITSGGTSIKKLAEKLEKAIHSFKEL